MKKILIAALLATTGWTNAQSLSHYVINAGGSDRQAAGGGFWLTDNIGEPFVATHKTSDFVLSEGFLQGDIVTIELGGVKIFNAVTPNADGKNDKWQIDGILEFPNNTVLLFNRWGQKVFEQKGYDNESKSWPNGNQLNSLVSSTYFYIIDLGNGSKPIKGWVELIKN
jgi:gliding motility-associated-like protein